MIYVQMGGRIGNQLFRYAAARTLQLTFYPSEMLCLDFGYLSREGDPKNGWINGLRDYNIPKYEIHDKDGIIRNEGSILQKLISAKYYIGLKKFTRYQMDAELEYEKKWSDILNKAGVYWYRTGYIELLPSTAKDKLMSGCFEAPEYFQKNRKLLIKEFTPRKAPLECNRKLYNLIENTNSVCVSIRRGDYESNNRIRDLHRVCDDKYFNKAIQLMMEYLDHPNFFLFSDDIEWARENIHIKGAKVYSERGDDPTWEKLRLMSTCKHFIISNSTFSWWGQWLSINPNKVVISPSRWYNNSYKSPLITSEMVTISV